MELKRLKVVRHTAAALRTLDPGASGAPLPRCGRSAATQGPGCHPGAWLAPWGLARTLGPGSHGNLRGAGKPLLFCCCRWIKTLSCLWVVCWLTRAAGPLLPLPAPPPHLTAAGGAAPIAACSSVRAFWGATMTELSQLMAVEQQTGLRQQTGNLLACVAAYFRPPVPQGVSRGRRQQLLA